MGIFSKKSSNTKTDAAIDATRQAALAALAFDNISDGVVIANGTGQVELANPAAATMLGYDLAGIINIDAGILFRFETAEGAPIDDASNQFLIAMRNNQVFTTREYVLINAQNKKHPVSISITPAINAQGEKVITFRDISKELETEGEQSEFISTASHEMRTPVASIEGYLGLALNPNCATIDSRARQYLEEAHASSQHLGRLFRDLLDITRLDDKKLKVNLVPVEISSVVREIVDGQVPVMSEKGIHYTFGSNSNMGDSGGGHVLDQEIYAAIDIDFLREIINNLIENAVKYNNEGGGIWVNVRGDGDRVLINVTDTGIGISPDDLKHIFQKFYRADNSQTRVIGGTGLGLYLVKERTEAMGGKVWAESSFGEGSTFYISFPRLTWEEYERRKQSIANIEMMQPQTAGNPVQSTEILNQIPTVQSQQAPNTPVPVAPFSSVESPTPAMQPQPAQQIPTVQNVTSPIQNQPSNQTPPNMSTPTT